MSQIYNQITDERMLNIESDIQVLNHPAIVDLDRIVDAGRIVVRDGDIWAATNQEFFNRGDGRGWGGRYGGLANN